MMTRNISALLAVCLLMAGCATSSPEAVAASPTSTLGVAPAAASPTPDSSPETAPEQTPAISEVAAADDDSAASQGRRVLVISIDGLRPDLMLLADCPALRSLIKNGSYCFWAKTTEMGNTLPSHTSMMTGRKIVHHGIHWNGDDAPEGVEYLYPQVPTLFDLAHAQGLTTAVFAGKSKFKTLKRPGAVDFSDMPEPGKGGFSDEQVARSAAKAIRKDAPQVMLLHLGEVDGYGHHHGWGTPEQLGAIEKADRAVKIALDALDKQGLREQTLIIVSADHGGFLKSHHGRDPRGRHIPWIVSGPGVKPGFDLTLVPDLEVETFDTFATACAFMGIPLPEKSEGQPVDAAFTNAPMVRPHAE